MLKSPSSWNVWEFPEIGLPSTENVTSFVISTPELDTAEKVVVSAISIWDKSALIKIETILVTLLDEPVDSSPPQEVKKKKRKNRD